MRTLQEHSLRESDFWTLAVRRRRGGGSLRALLPNNFERPSRNQIKTYPAVPGDRLGRVADAFVNSFASTLTGRKYRSTDSWISFLTTSRNRPDSEALFLDVRWGRVPADLLDMAASLFQTQRHFLQEFPNFHKNKEHETDHIRQKQQNFDYVAPKYNLIWRPESLDPMCSERELYTCQRKIVQATLNPTGRQRIPRSLPRWLTRGRRSCGLGPTIFLLVSQDRLLRRCGRRCKKPGKFRCLAMSDHLRQDAHFSVYLVELVDFHFARLNVVEIVNGTFR
jgi:hypothetical protein